MNIYQLSHFIKLFNFPQKVIYHINFNYMKILFTDYPNSFVNFYIYDLSAQFYSHSKLFRPNKIGNIVPFQIFLNQNIFSPEQTQAF